MDGTPNIKTERRVGFLLHDHGGRNILLDSLVFSGQGGSVRVGFPGLIGASFLECSGFWVNPAKACIPSLVPKCVPRWWSGAPAPLVIEDLAVPLRQVTGPYMSCAW